MLHHVIAFKGSILTLYHYTCYFPWQQSHFLVLKKKKKKKTKLTIAKSSSEVEYRVVDFTIAKFA